MIALLTTLARFIGVGGVVAIGLLFFYEGIPGASRIPFITSIPVLSDLIAGRVATHAANEVQKATASMVSKVENDALKAQLEMERHLNDALKKANEELARRSLASEATAKQRQEALEKALDAAKGFQRPTQEELQWLNKR